MAPAVPEAGPALGPRRPRAGVDMGWVLRGLSIPLIKPDIRKMQKLYYILVRRADRDRAGDGTRNCAVTVLRDRTVAVAVLSAECCDLTVHWRLALL